MGQFVDNLIFRQEMKELLKYLDSRDMTIIDIITLLQNHLSMLQCDLTMKMIDELKKERGANK